MEALLLEYLGPPAIGGVERLVSALATALRGAGHAPEIWATDLQTFRGPRHTERTALADAIPVRRFRTVRWPIGVLDPHHLTWIGLERALRARPGTLIHAHSLPSWQAHTALRRAATGAPVVITVHHDIEGLRAYAELRRGRALLARIRDAMRANPRFALTVTTAREQPFWVTEVGLPAERVVVIPNGCDPAEFDAPTAGQIAASQAQWPAGAFRVLFAGRLVRAKGVDVLLHALADIPDAALLIAGPDGGDGDALRALARDLSLGERVRFLEVTRPQLAATFRAADAVVVPSRSGENFGIVAVEAMAARRPVIVTDCGGLPEVVTNEESGLVIPRDDPSALYTALIRVRDNPALRARVGESGRARVLAHYTWERVTGEFLRLYNRLLAA